MVLKTRDWGFIVVIGAVLLMLLFNTGGEKPHIVPSDEKHRPLLDLLAKGKAREEVPAYVLCPKNIPQKNSASSAIRGKGEGSIRRRSGPLPPLVWKAASPPFWVP